MNDNDDHSADLPEDIDPAKLKEVIPVEELVEEPIVDEVDLLADEPSEDAPDDEMEDINAILYPNEDYSY